MRAAASFRASSWGAGRSFSAALVASGETASSAAEAGVHGSRLVVYSSKAWARRSGTASRIRAVALSTASSCAASKASRRPSSASNPGAELSSRRGSATAGRAQRLDERRDRVALELERSGGHDQPARHRHDLLDHAQAIRLEGRAGVDEVDDRLRKPDQGSKLHRSVELDQVHVHALGGEELARRADVLCGDSQARALLHRRRVVEPLGHRDYHAASRNAEVERLVKALAAVLGEEVAPGAAKVGGAG